MDRFVLWGIIIIAFVVVGQRLYRHFYDHIQPEHSLKVVVTGKRIQEFMGRTSKEETELPPPRQQFYVSFSPRHEQEREFQVSEHLYEQLILNSSGTLVFRGRRFIAFEPDDISQDSD
ncbi:DUF2500 domain-containing protein [Oceanimonas baumannii]|uniref:DUF2500 domain-containing protein n=1 Tax=Oceanimonas baumannii TaxID=129578 RepID=UPI001D18F60F|nr:DUF2500 domain-containing protein [Oceanimonas baumannii]MCC4264373.1 DUF2500 domain-containing protein [Oceanimonas baumannii]